MAFATKRDLLTSDALIVCEGSSDEAFFHALIAAGRIPAFSVRQTADAGKGKGNDHFGDFLAALVNWDAFEKLQNVILVSDNDSNPAVSFNKVRAQVEGAHPDADPPIVFEAPRRACQTAHGSPAVTIIMLPWRGRRGCLETLCLDAAREATDRSVGVMRCVEGFARCTGADGWPASKLSKMQLQAMLVGQNKRNPCVSLSNVWRDELPFIPLDHACFDDLCEFLSRFDVRPLV